MNADIPSPDAPSASSAPFEINTDAALVDPDWEAFAGRHEERYGLAIHHLKSLVDGSSFDNDAVRLRVGPQGFYLQSRRFPAHFCGGTGEADVEFVSEDEAHAVVWEATAAYRAGEARSLTCVYRDGDPPEAFFGYRVDDEECYEMGVMRGGLPLHLRVMVDGAADSALVGGPRGLVVYQRTVDGRHLVLRRAGRPNPYQPAGTLQG